MTVTDNISIPGKYAVERYPALKYIPGFKGYCTDVFRKTSSGRIT